MHSQVSDVFIIKQLDKLTALYEKQMVDIGKAIEKLYGMIRHSKQALIDSVQ